MRKVHIHYITDATIMPIPVKITAFFIICACLLGSNCSFGDEAKLSDIVVSNEGEHLVVYVSVEGAFPDKMKKAVMSGVPSTFSFNITLDRVRNFWFDEEIAELEATHTVKYHCLKKEYAVTRSWEGGTRVVKSFREAKKLMTEIAGMKITDLDNLRKKSKYQLRTKAELSKVSLPFHLHYVLFFLSLWDFETDWHAMDFEY